MKVAIVGGGVAGITAAKKYLKIIKWWGAIILGERKDAAIIRRIITDKIDISNFKAHLFREDFDLRQALGY